MAREKNKQNLFFQVPRERSTSCLSLGYFTLCSLFFIFNQKLYIKGCRKVPLSGWNKCSLGFEAGKRKQQAKQTSEVIILLLAWDTVFLILVFWKLGTLTKQSRVLLQQRTSQRRESRREPVPSHLFPWWNGIKCHQWMLLYYTRTLVRPGGLEGQLVAGFWNLTGRNPTSSTALEWVNFTPETSQYKKRRISTTV